MKAKSILLAVLFVTGACFSASGQNKQDYKVLYEKAKYTMDTKGDPKTAIGVFNDLIRSFPDAKDYCALSQVMIGICYEKLGKAEAIKAYQAVLDNYPDQTEAVQIARGKLAALMPARAVSGHESISFRKIMDLPQGYSFTSVSPSGRYLLLGDQDGMVLKVKDLETGESWPVSPVGSKEKQMSAPSPAIFSPDEKQVAYMWWDGLMMDATELTITDLDGRNRRIVSHMERERDTTSCPFPLGWSADGKYLLGGTIIYKNKAITPAAHLVLMSIADGSCKWIMDATPSPQISNMGLFPGNRSIYFSRDQEIGSRNKDIYVKNIEDKTETTIISHPSNDDIPFLSKDGRYLVFLSDRYGSNGLFIQEMNGMRPVGEPRLVKANLEDNFMPSGLTDQGSLFYQGGTFDMNIYTGEVGSGSSLSLGSAEKLPVRMEGNNIKPAWSPDGKYLAYISITENIYTYKLQFTIRDLKTGEERRLPTSLYPGTATYYVSLQWTPDSRYLVVNGKEDDYYANDGFYKIDITNGRNERILGENRLNRYGTFGFYPQYAPDGKDIYFIDSTRMKIMCHDLAGNKDKSVFQAGQRIGFFALSHDGKKLAIGEANDMKDSLNGLVILTLKNGKIEHFANPERNRLLTFPEWTPDDTGVVVLLNPSGKLYLFPANGGDPVEMDLKNKDMGYIRFSPDGKQYAFDQLVKRNKEIWAIDHFLPAK